MRFGGSTALPTLLRTTATWSITTCKTFGTTARYRAVLGWMLTLEKIHLLLRTATTWFSHEVGYDNQETSTPAAITATLISSEFDLDDGDKFMFVKRMLPDVTFEGSTADAPAATMTLSPMENSGSGYNNPLSEGGNSSATVTRSATVPIEQFTGQVFVRVRGRQMAFKIESTELGVAWKLGIPRLDMRPDGRRG
jgi:hypothetical protein